MMSENNKGQFVNLVKKAVGIPTGKSDCCGSATAASESACCTATPAPKAGSEKAAGGSCCG